MSSSGGERGRVGPAASLLVALLVVPLAVAALAVGPAAAVADTTGSTVDTAAPAFAPAAASCSSTANGTLVAASLPAAGTYGPGDTVAVYRGTELVVERCRGDGTLDASDADGLAVLSESRDRLHLRVERRVTVAGEPVDSGAGLGALVASEPARGPNLTVVDPAAETALVDGSLAVPTAERASEVEDAEATYAERERALREQLAALEATTATVEEGERVGATDTAFDAALAAHDRYRAAYDDLRLLLYEVAASDVGTARTTATITALEGQHAELNERIEDSVGGHDAALVERDRSLTWSLRSRILGLGALGLLVGAGLGAALPFRRGRAARRKLRRGEWATYSRRLVLYPAIVGALVLLAGLCWFALRAGWYVLEVVA